MALFFSRVVTSSPIKRRSLRAELSCQSPELSLLSDDSFSFACYSTNTAGGSPCSCRRSRRLLANGYYVLTEDSFSWDDEGNVSLTPSKTNVSYKENLVRIFRRKRRARRSLASLLSGVTETCQSWLDDSVFRGVFASSTTEPVGQDPAWQNQAWQDQSTSEPDSSFSFTYDHREIIPPPEKEAPPPQTLTQEEICTETCHSQEQFIQSLGGLSEVPPPLAFHDSRCCSPATEKQTRSSTMRSLFSFILTVFICIFMFSRSPLWSLAVVSAVFITIMAFMFFTKMGLMSKWRKAKTEDITSRNE